MNSPVLKTVRSSTFSRLMQCSGPVFLTASYDQPEDPAAAEGTAAGELFEILAAGKKPETLQASNGIYFDEEMYIQAEKIIAMEPWVKSGRHQVKTEWIAPSGTKVTGTLDVCYEYTDGSGYSHLIVGDYKYGFGIVDVVNNYQLSNYMIGYPSGKIFDYYHYVIMQPRAHHEEGPVRKWSISRDEMIKIYNDISDRLGEINRGDRTLRSGPHCRYCPYLAVDCPSASRALNLTLDYVYHDGVKDNINPDQASLLMDQINRATSILEHRYDMLEQYVKSLIIQGKKVPNYTMVDARSKRVLNSSATPEVIKTLLGTDPYRKVLKTPSQLEDEGFSRSIIDSISHTPFKGKTLKRIEDSKLLNKMFDLNITKEK